MHLKLLTRLSLIPGRDGVGSRWLREWIPSLSGRKKWRCERDDLKFGDVVIVMSTDNARGRWPLGRIVKVFPGKDDKV